MTRSIKILQISHISSNSAADGSLRRSLKWHVANVKNNDSDDQVTLRIDQNTAITEIYTYEIDHGLSKNIFLLHGHQDYDSIV